jgi:hypothetical protein
VNNPACYLKGYSPCDDKLSSDHLISKSIITQIGNKAIYHEGLPWCKDLKQVGIGNITGRVLCWLHNSQLSDFDTSAAKLFRCLHQLPRQFAENTKRAECIVNGQKIELWMLKTMVTLLASGNASPNGQIVQPRLEPAWLRVLSRIEEFGPGCGLYLEQPTSQKTEMMEEFTIRLVWIDDTCIGVTTSFLGFLFHLFTAKNKFPRSHLYRPGGIIFRRGQTDKVLAIHYGSSGFGQAPIIEV